MIKLFKIKLKDNYLIILIKQYPLEMEVFMEFKKCARCGSFFVTDGEICQNCAPKDRLDMVKFKDYIESTSGSPSVDSISIDTGISTKNVNRYLSQN